MAAFVAYTVFSGNAMAGSATVIANGADLPNFGVGSIQFTNASLGNATLIANGGSGQGAYIYTDNTPSNTARVEIYDNGRLVTGYDGDCAVGSVEGNGSIMIALTYNLAVGANNLSTTFPASFRTTPTRRSCRDTAA